MSGVFPKDIWCLLFREHFDYDTVIALRLVSKRLRDFMTDEQRHLLGQISACKQEYRKDARAYLKKLKANHLATLAQLESSHFGTCSCCGKTMKWRNLSKHQRMCSRVKKMETPRDRCLSCGWAYPFCDNSHAWGCPVVTNATCEHCHLSVNREHLYHACPLALKWCHYCMKPVPFAVHKIHRCKFICQFNTGNQPCRGRCMDESGYCASHQKPRCQAKTKRSRHAHAHERPKMAKSIVGNT